MQSITIAVQGEELETINVELTTEEVRALYNFRKEATVKIASLTKELDTAKSNVKYSQDRLNAVEEEINEGHTLLSALGVKDKTEHEESYYRKDLKIATRIALYIAAGK